jgi:hypothetical protein
MGAIGRNLPTLFVVELSVLPDKVSANLKIKLLLSDIVRDESTANRE